MGLLVERHASVTIDDGRSWGNDLIKIFNLGSDIEEALRS